MATVVNRNGDGVAGEDVVFSSSDAGQTIGAVTDNSDGTYTATITSSKTIGQATITATDTAVTPGASAHTTLTQVAGPPASLTVRLSPSTIVGDGASTSTATATLSDAGGNPIPGNSISFSSSDRGEKLGPVTDQGNGTYTATITSSTTAGTQTITAVDTSLSPGVSGQQTLTQLPGPPKSVTLQLSPSAIIADGVSSSTATATVTDAHGNLVPGNSVHFSSSDRGVHFGSTTDHGNGAYIVTVTGSTTPGSQTITAVDTSVSPTVSGYATLIEIPASSLMKVTMQWTFYYTPAYTKVLTLVVNGAPAGATVLVTCHGYSCPFARRGTLVARTKRCGRHGGRRCLTHGIFDLAPRFAGHRLYVGARLVVEIVRPRWIGKYYAFTVRARRGPRIRIACLPPGGRTPGLGC